MGGTGRERVPVVKKQLLYRVGILVPCRAVPREDFRTSLPDKRWFAARAAIAQSQSSASDSCSKCAHAQNWMKVTIVEHTAIFALIQIFSASPYCWVAQSESLKPPSPSIAAGKPRTVQDLKACSAFTGRWWYIPQCNLSELVSSRYVS